MAEYLILIAEDEKAYAAATPDVYQQVMEAHIRFAEQVPEKGGKIVEGRALQPTSTATTIRGDVVTDGPFVETKEAIGGYYLIEARDLDHALEIGKLCPSRFGCVEVRPNTLIGRTSTQPNRAGHSLPISSAWSRSRASIR